MKKILGLDLGTTSIGWAIVHEAESDKEKSSIIRSGVRLVPLENFTNGEGKEIKMKISDAFASGISVSTKAARRNSKTARVNNARFKERRDGLIRLLKQSGWITDETPLCEEGKGTTYETLRLRANAVNEEISLEALARVLLMINKKRGYKSNRKLKGAEEGDKIDGIEIARILSENDMTPGQYVNELYNQGKKYAPQFYPSDLQAEFVRVWDNHKEKYPVLTDELLEKVRGRNEKATWAILAEPLGLKGIKRAGKPAEQKRENYQWRADAVKSNLDKEQLAIVLGRINADINSSSGYLGAISDRSKLLFFRKQTIGQYLWGIVMKNRHEPLKGKVFYREDYLDEFERIWETQAKFHPEELTRDLKKKIQREFIFFQRPLKSQKGRLDFCTLESREVKRTIDGKELTIKEGLKVCPKSSPLFQEFKVWQGINNLEILDKETFEIIQLSDEGRKVLFAELNMKPKLSKRDILKILGYSAKRYDINFEELPGNTTRSILYGAFLKMLPITGHTEIDVKKASAFDIETIVHQVFDAVGFNTDILDFNTNIEDEKYYQHPAYDLWHLLYSSEGKNIEKHIDEICHFGEVAECAKILANITFANDYGNLSAKAIRKILPYMRQGQKYSDACLSAGYNHSSRSLTKEQNEKRELLDRLPEYKSGALRNPVVDKVLAQMTNVVNNIIKEYGRPDEIRVEMAREMKRSIKERVQMTDAIRRNTENANRIRELLQTEFGFTHPTSNDIVRWRLYEELACNGYKTFYSNTYIRREEVFSKKFDIEHIIPQARLFDDSFSNKTLELKSVNQKKNADTALDYMVANYTTDEVEEYKSRVNSAFVNGAISRTKKEHLLMKAEDIPTDFIQRDLRETQYITREACALLEKVTRSVVATSGSITEYLREEWQLVDVMKELNLPKYEKLGLVREDKNRDGMHVKRIEGWTKRSDHRHHAMDAITVAFTRRSAIQYLNTLNARPDMTVTRHITSPMPLNDLRAEARKSLEAILVSERTSKKVCTTHIDKRTGKSQLIPRGALHADTYYGSIIKDGETIFTTRKDISPDLDVNLVIDGAIKKILEERLHAYGNDSKKAFVALDENPIWLNKEAGIKIKRVTIRSKKASNPIPIHQKRDNYGKLILDNNGNPIPSDYVAPDANHHIAFYVDEKGKLHENVVSFYEAVERKRQSLPVIDTDYMKEEGWRFVFSLQRGEYIVFPAKNFIPADIDMTDKNEFATISPHLFLVQKLSKKNYMFRHHLDPSTDDNKLLRGINWENIRNIPALEGLYKVQLNTLGEIVKVTPMKI